MTSIARRTPAALFAAILVTACSTTIALTDQGSHVQRVTEANAPFGCELLGDVAIGIPPDAGRPRTEGQLETLMRNKAGELGATHVVLDYHQQRTAAGGEIYFVGRGRAYACHGSEAESGAPVAPAAAAPDETAGGEEPAEAPPEE